MKKVHEDLVLIDKYVTLRWRQKGNTTSEVAVGNTTYYDLY